MCDPASALVTLLKMRPHYSQYGRENATPSSGTSPLASYKEVTPRDFWTMVTFGKIISLSLQIFKQRMVNFLVIDLRDYTLRLLRFSKTRQLWSSKSNWPLRFSLPSIILADLLGNRTLLKRVQKDMVCDLWSVDFYPFCALLCFKVCCLWS